MNMKLTMLGTGHAVVTDYYNTCFLLTDEDRPAGDRHFLVDTEEGAPYFDGNLFVPDDLEIQEL